MAKQVRKLLTVPGFWFAFSGCQRCFLSPSSPSHFLYAQLLLQTIFVLVHPAVSNWRILWSA